MRYVFKKLQTPETRTCRAFEAGTSNPENRDMLEMITDSSSGSLISLKPQVPATRRERKALPDNITHACGKIFGALRAVAVSSLTSLDKSLGLAANTLQGLCRVGNSDMLRIAQYTGGGRDLEAHADPCLLTVHVGLDRDECEHVGTTTTDGEVKQEERDRVCATVFSSAQLEILTSGRVQASVHRASAASRRQMIVFFCYVDSDVMLQPIDMGDNDHERKPPIPTCPLPITMPTLTKKNESTQAITGGEYIQRLKRSDKHGLPDYAITIADLRAHWRLVEQLVETKPAFPGATMKTFWEEQIERYLFFLACIKAGGRMNDLQGPPNPPREVCACVFICWLISLQSCIHTLIHTYNAYTHAHTIIPWAGALVLDRSFASPKVLRQGLHAAIWGHSPPRQLHPRPGSPLTRIFLMVVPYLRCSLSRGEVVRVLAASQIECGLVGEYRECGRVAQGCATDGESVCERRCCR